MFLGIVLATLIHAAIEFPILRLVTSDYARYGQGFVWQNWDVIHGGGGQLLLILGALGGFLAGRKFWQILYVEKRYGTPRW